MTHVQGYHILYHHKQGVVERKTYRLLAKIFSESEQTDRCLMVPINLLQILIFPSICSLKLKMRA